MMSVIEPSVNDYVEIIKPLPLRLRLSYGIGHVLNDVCASMWFTYLLVYFHFVLQFDSILSGIVLLVGQVADALATPFVGIQSDITDGFWLCKYGRRKSWHLVGTLCVLGSFPFIFSSCIHCENSDHWAQLIYYSSFVIIFQFGWASVQISHLSLIPDLTPCEHERTSLTAIRYSFTVISNIFVYVITWSVLHMTDDSNAQIGSKDGHKFQMIVLICIGVGAVTSFVFHLFVKEQNLYNSAIASSPGSKKSIGHLLSSLQLYQVGAVYMATRLFVNLSQVYVPLYLHETLNKSAESLAVVPLVMFLSSFVVSLVVKPLNQRFGRKIAYFQGAVIGIGACTWIYFDTGASGSVMLVTSLGITADFIGPNTDNGAFVYGAMSFSDKLSNGVGVTIIQYLKCSAHSQCARYYGNVLGFACGGAALFGVISVFTLVPFKYNRIGGKSYSPVEEEPSEAENVISPSQQT
ncbi:Major facilitator superfamily domain-containing protein 12 [Gryllus bimaculatus]|nr:Major facilitator superfamily domain-containing protein 12 [Gryllus bimaculatus]